MKKKTLVGKKALVSAGPTYEPIDPVRFIGNYSSGIMGFEIAHELSNCGADVVLVSGPTHLDVVDKSIKFIKINTAAQMKKAMENEFENSDIIVMAAAVADYKPAAVNNEKIKKEKANLSLDLMPTDDILAGLGKIKAKNQLLCGFALETSNGLNAAKDKLRRKNLDLIVLNTHSEKNPCFGVDYNQVSFITKDEEVALEKTSKRDIALNLIQYLEEKFLKINLNNVERD